jgi:2-succinyl-5-enolpyruvyl-6-hydroxy-3-cyclohexene-1-carboxylate synthase
VAASHHTSAGGWAKERGFVYLQAENDIQLQEALKQFTQPDYAAPMLLEVKTNSQVTAEVFKAYYHHLK